MVYVTPYNLQHSADKIALMHAIETRESQVPPLEPVGGEWSASRAARFAPVTHSVGGFGEKNLLLQIGMEPVLPFRLPSSLISTLTTITAEVRNTRVCSSTSPYVCAV